MMDPTPQAPRPADDPRERILEYQARAIWPQERDILLRYRLPERLMVLDAGCGTGEISFRLACLFPGADVLGVDILDDRLDRARRCFGPLAPRLSFARQNLFSLDVQDDVFDLTVCRHVLHALPRPERVVRELVRVTRPDGLLHLILEDYGMLHFDRGVPDPRDFWHEAPAAFGRATGTDLFSGRHALALLRAHGLLDVTIDYVVVDTLRVPRELFAAIMGAWRDAYAPAIAGVTRFDRAEVIAHFDAMIANILDPDGYAVWMVPVVSARVPPGPAA